MTYCIEGQASPALDTFNDGGGGGGVEVPECLSRAVISVGMWLTAW